jgi:integrase/recombinase XerD
VVLDKLKQPIHLFYGILKKIEIKNLNRENAMRLIQNLSTNMEVENWEIFRNHIYEQTDGNPRAINELIDRYRKETFLTSEVIREIKHTGALKEIDFTFMVVVTLAILTVFKFLSRDLEQPSLKIIGAAAMILLLIIRPVFSHLKKQFI